MKQRFFGYILIALLFTACTSEPEIPYVPLDLMEHGIPMTIHAPDSVDIKTDDLLGIMKEVSIRKGDDYFVQVYSSTAQKTDPAAVKAEQVADAKRDPYFSKIITDEPNGFIYETKLDSTRLNYGFRYIKIEGTNEYIFRTGMIGTFDLEAVEAMYEGVKKAE